jgi:hypothetical protein
MEIKNTEFKTEDQKKQDETIRKIVLSHCVACHQQLDLLQLRLINFDDLIKGVIDTIKTTKNLLDQQEIIKDDQKPKLKKV